MKYALVTGCDHGIGLHLVRCLAERGYTVAACRHDENERNIDAFAEQYPEKIFIFPLDISSDQSVQAMRDAVEKTFPYLDLVINNAGILGDMEKGPDVQLNFDLMLQVINLNALGALRVSSSLLPLLRKGQDKTVINISSEAGSITDCERTGWFGYCMSKTANNMQGALLHNTLRREGGQVIQMHPGHVATYMRGHLDASAPLTPDISARGILATALDTPHPVGERPLFLDYQGKELPW